MKGQHEDGRIYVADFNNGRLYQVFTDGTVETLLTGIANTAGGGFGTDGHFYYSALAAGTIHQYQSDGTVSAIASGNPNPATNRIQLSYHLRSTSDLVWQILDSTGQTVLQDALQKVNAGQQQIQIDLHQLPVGIYFLQLRSQDGHSISKQFSKSE